jgi:hypothetical protein
MVGVSERERMGGSKGGEEGEGAREKEGVISVGALRS